MGTTSSGRDDGLRKPTVVLCCKRLGNGSWCHRPDRHKGKCKGPPAEYGPLEERPALWRSMKGRTR